MASKSNEFWKIGYKRDIPQMGKFPKFKKKVPMKIETFMLWVGFLNIALLLA